MTNAHETQNTQLQVKKLKTDTRNKTMEI